MSNILHQQWLDHVSFSLFFHFSYDSEDSRDSTDSKQDDQMVGCNYLLLIKIQVVLYIWVIDQTFSIKLVGYWPSSFLCVNGTGRSRDKLLRNRDCVPPDYVQRVKSFNISYVLLFPCSELGNSFSEEGGEQFTTAIQGCCTEPQVAITWQVRLVKWTLL